MISLSCLCSQIFDNNRPLICYMNIGNTVDSHYNDTVGIREKYRYIQLSIYPVILSLFSNGWDIEIAS